MSFIGIFAIFCLFSAVTAQYGPSHGRSVVCLGFTNRDVTHRYERNFTKFNDINLNLCTHIHAITENSHLNFKQDIWNSTSNENEEDYKQMTNLKEKYPHLKIILTIASNYLTKHLNNSELFANKITDFVLRYGFDGLDISFMYNRNNNSDKIVTMFKKLKESFRSFNLLLTVSFAFNEKNIDNYNLVAISNHIDYMYFTPNHLYTKDDVFAFLHIKNMEKRIKQLIASGVPSMKILMDLFFDGIQFVNQTIDTFHMPYGEVCKLNETSEWDRSYDANASLNTLTNEENKSILFEGTRSIANRARLAVNLNLRGVITFMANTDDFRGDCGFDDDTFEDFNNSIPVPTNLTFPLLRTINQAIYLTLNKSIPEDITGNGAGSKYDTYYNLFDKFAKFLDFVKSLD